MARSTPVFDENKTRIWPRAGFEQKKKVLCMRKRFDLQRITNVLRAKFEK